MKLVKRRITLVEELVFIARYCLLSHAGHSKDWQNPKNYMNSSNVHLQLFHHPLSCVLYQALAFPPQNICPELQKVESLQQLPQ